jgi:hypothetical protein
LAKDKAMDYTEDAIIKIKRQYAEIKPIYRNLLFKTMGLNSKLHNEKSREYLTHGAGRRLKVLARCIENVFKIFPVDRSDFLIKDELTDLAINLHVFFVNISGILDNLAWVFVYENNLFGKREEGKISRHDVGLFNEKTQAHLGSGLNEYLKSDTLQTWYTEYSKNYRDALAHRIPLYVPPSALNKEEIERYRQIEEQLWDYSSPEAVAGHQQIIEEQSKLGRPCVVFAHSYSEKSKLVYFHAQVIADFMTIEEIINKFCDNFKKDG